MCSRSPLFSAVLMQFCFPLRLPAVRPVLFLASTLNLQFNDTRILSYYTYGVNQNREERPSMGVFYPPVHFAQHHAEGVEAGI